MEKTKNVFKKMALFGMILLTIAFLGSCKKGQDPPLGGIDSTLSIESLSAVQKAGTMASGTSINVSGLKSDGGYSYKLGYALSQSGDANENLTKSKLRLFENGVELKPPHSVHQNIRNYGKGRFSHWGTALYFSTSDNTNPATNGRKYTFKLDGSGNAPVVKPPTDEAETGGNVTLPAGVNAGLLGYATVNGTTTGGSGGSSVTVTSLSALKAAVGADGARIIYVSGTIKGSGRDYMYVKGNKSIIGKPGASLEGIQLFIYSVKNVIVQDLKFKNYVNDAAVQIKEAANHIWVDHCEFSNDLTHGWDYWGKDIAITRESDYITVSWSKFHDTNLSVLISGGIEGHEADKGKLHVTMHHNYWYNVGEREPTMNFGSVHMFNNYHLNNTSYSLGARAGGIIRTDNEYFSNCRKPITTNLAGDPPGYFSGINTNVYTNCGSNSITTPVSTWVPAYSYRSALNAAADVPALVKQGTGPRAIH